MRLTPITSLRDSQDLRSDAIDLAHLNASTIASSEIGLLRWGNVSLANIISYTAEKYENDIRKDRTTPAISLELKDGLGSDIDRSEHLVIRDLDLPQVEPSDLPSPGRIVAHIEYQYNPADWFSRSRPALTDHQTPMDPRIHGANEVLMQVFIDKIYQNSELHAGGRECYMVTALHTLDTHLRKGIASQLIQWIFPYADATQRPVFLEASPVGAPVYQKNGYENVGGDEGIVEVQLAKWGGTPGAVHRLIAMRRMPQRC